MSNNGGPAAASAAGAGVTPADDPLAAGERARAVAIDPTRTSGATKGGEAWQRTGPPTARKLECCLNSDRRPGGPAPAVAGVRGPSMNARSAAEPGEVAAALWEATSWR